MSSLPSINIVWLKRDLRLQDHEPLLKAAQANKPLLLLYIFEPSLVQTPDYDVRHWRFVWESLMDLNSRLKPFNTAIHICYQEVLEVFEKLGKSYIIDTVFSHQETGIKLTYDRDKQMKNWFDQRGIDWQESQTGGVVRGLKNRKDWRNKLLSAYIQPVSSVPFERVQWLTLSVELSDTLQDEAIPVSWKAPNPQFQPGGESAGWRYLNSFFGHRYARYQVQISKPNESRTSCSRLSPYITWGCLSVRQVFQAYEAKRPTTPNTKNLDAFMSRLLWQSHFIQKFEMEDAMEFQNTNSGYDRIRTVWNEAYYTAWAEGKTGFPLIDAAMNCVKETGWINFRLRATLISFLTHMLWLDWKRGAIHLGKYFLDFEPGIHYPQVQMQAGTTGVNTYRIYNPVKQSQQHDPEGIFIKKWVPDLRKLDAPNIHTPWLLGPLEQQWLKFTPGVDYPLPIIDADKAYKHAQENLWAMNDDPVVQFESARILDKHVNRDRKNWAKRRR